jgi:hypothetical protein
MAYLVALTSDAEHCSLRLQARVPGLSDVVFRTAETAFDRRVLALGPICGHEKLFHIFMEFIRYLMENALLNILGGQSPVSMS